MNSPKVIKAPGAKIRMSIGSKLAPKIGKPAREPEPNSSRTKAIIIKANIKPNPMPNPSKADRKMLFFPAKA